MRPGRLLIALGMAALVCSAAAQVALAKPGDLIVTSYNPGMVTRIDPATRHQSVISDDPKFQDPQGLSFSPSGEIFVADYGANTIFRVNPKTGQTTVRSADPDLQDPQYVDMGPDRKLYVPDDSVGSLFRIAPGSSDAVPFSSGGQFVLPYGVEVAHDASILVADDGSKKLIRVNRATGAQHLVADTSSQDPYLAGITEAPNGIIYASTSDPAILRINPKTGGVSTVASGGFLHSAYDVAIAPNGKLYATNYDFTPGDPEVLKINPKTGAQSVVARNGDKLHAAAGIEIEPPKCGGKTAMIVGSDKADHLSGSKFADVIAGLGGDDVIKGLRGNDLICAGPGDDVIRDTRGKNKIDCGPGHDTVITNRRSRVAKNCEDVTRR
jgi:streptogramin lyase